MLNRFFGHKFHYPFHLFGAILFAIGLPSSKIILSISTILLFLNLLLERDFRNYWMQLKGNRFLHYLLLFAVLHILSLVWTTDYAYAINDLRIKLTLFAIPILLACKPFEAKSIRIILAFFVATLLLTSLINVCVYLQQTFEEGYSDIRKLSLFGSHIRYGILVAIGAAILLHEFKEAKSSRRVVLLILLFWFCWYTYYSQVLSGMISMLLVLSIFTILYFFQTSKTKGIIALAVCVCIPLSVLVYLVLPKKIQSFSPQQLTERTAFGNEYTHNLSPNTYVNGRPVLAFVCEKELKLAWENRSTLPYYGIDSSQQPVRFTIMRYMTSKNLRKDAGGMQRLSEKDIENIERGMTSVEEKNVGLLARIEGIKWQIHNSVDPNGHSLLQRIEFWKTALYIIEKNWLIGVGVGDVQAAFDLAYANSNSRLTVENRLRAHNSFLTAWISFGMIGLLTFLWMNFYYFYHYLRKRNYLALVFISVAIVTFLIEDTLETQMGVSFFAFFYMLFSQPNPVVQPKIYPNDETLVSEGKA